MADTGINDAVKEMYDELFDEMLTPEQRDYVVLAVMTWLQHAAKRPVVDLEQRMAQFEKRVRRMAQDLEVKYEEGKVVFKATGSTEDVLRDLRLGTSWFEPNVLWEETILAGLFEQARS